MRHIHALALSLVAALAVGGPAIGCGAERASLYRTQAPLEVRELEKGTWSGVHEQVECVFRAPEEWQAFYRRHAPERTPPGVDFETEMVVAILLPRNTGGYTVTLDRVEETPSQVVVHYTEQRPSPEAIVTQALTEPHVFAAVPRRDQAVVFRHQARVSTQP